MTTDSPSFLDSHSAAVAGDVYAVTGHPVQHSLSPLIHRHFAQVSRQDLSYELLPAPPEGFFEVARAFFGAGGRGLNVTLPFKEQARELVDRCDSAASLAGAVNTIRRAKDGSLEGFNTDGLGLVKDLENNLGWSLSGNRVLLIGAGGASRGALDALLAAGPASVTLANRTTERAETLVAEVAPADQRVRVCAPAQLTGTYDLIINATSASLAGQGALVPTEVVSGARCYDMLYAPQQTVFAGWALSHGALEVADGLGMLLEQAAEAFYLWRNVRPDTAELLAQRSALFAAKQADASSLQTFLDKNAATMPAAGSTPDAATLSQPHASGSGRGKKPRFIAGAVCPQCREVDRLLVRDTETGREQACVACGFTQPETQTSERSAQGAVPRGKHERPSRPNSAALETQTLRFIDPSTTASQASVPPPEKTD